MKTSQPNPPSPPRLPNHQLTPNECRHDQHNWSAFETQRRHANCRHAAHQSDLLLELHRKLNPKIDSNYTPVWISLKTWFNYDATATLIACSNYDRRIDFVHCGYACGARRFACKDRLLCPRCCYVRHALQLSNEFGENIPPTLLVFYLCLGFSRNPDERSRLKYRDFEQPDCSALKRRRTVAPLEPSEYGVALDTADDIEQCRLIWKLISEAIREFFAVKNRSIRGAVGGPELAVQFQPLRCLPHANFVVWTSSFTVDDARELRRLIRQKMRNCRRLHLQLYPSVACYRLRAQDDRRAVLKYSLKPIALAAAYTSAAERVDYTPSALATLNSEVNTFLRRLPDVFHGVRRVERYGGCHAGAKNYFGVVTPPRAARRERDAQRRAALRQNGSMTALHPKTSKATTPHKRRRPKASRFSYWFAAVMPPPPPAPPTEATPSQFRPPRWVGDQ